MQEGKYRFQAGSGLKQKVELGSMAEETKIGHLIGNRYLLLEMLGRGSMGSVYLGKDLPLERLVALKFLSRTLLNSDMCDRFHNEARICAQLGAKSIHIVQVSDYGVDEEDQPFYVMEYLEGENLRDLLDQGPFPLPRCLTLIRQVCLGLQCAHAGIQVNPQSLLCPVIHRDIKPSNILVVRESSLEELIKILDFGISSLLQADDSKPEAYMGTLAYSSPEQIASQDLDGRSDIYSLGIVMFEMLTGRHPLEPETPTFAGWYHAHQSQAPRSLAAASPDLKLPKALEDLVTSCLAKVPGDRPQSVAEILKVIDPLEQRYTASRQVGQYISEALAKKPIGPSQIASDVLKFQPKHVIPIWPKEIPIGKVVVARPFSGDRPKPVPAIWVMLPHAEIQTIQIHRLYNQIYQTVLSCLNPYPMLLWLTAIFNPHQSRRWFPVYLDLKSRQGQETVRLLIEHKAYQVLFFDLEPPHCCSHQITVTLKPEQYPQLQYWLILAQSQPSTDFREQSRRLLKAEYDKLKPRIEQELGNRQ